MARVYPHTKYAQYEIIGYESYVKYAMTNAVENPKEYTREIKFACFLHFVPCLLRKNKHGKARQPVVNEICETSLFIYTSPLT